MNIEYLRTKKQWLALKEEWIRLEKLQDTSCNFRSFGMFESYMHDCDLVLQFRKDSTIYALIPLSRNYLNLWKTIGYRDFNYACFLCHPEAIQEVVQALVLWQKRHNRVIQWKGLRGWDEVDRSFAWNLQSVSVDSSIFTLPTCFLDLTTVSEEFLKQKRKNHSLARREKRLAKRGEILVKKLTSQHLPEMLVLHQKRWGDRRDTSGVLTNTKQEWLIKMWENPEDDMHVCVLGLYVNNQLIAFQYEFISGKQIVGYWTGFDPEYAPFAPGFLLLEKSVMYWKEQQKEVFDFSIGYEIYKEQWASGHREAWILVTSPRKWVMQYQAIRGREKLRQQLKTSPDLVKMVRLYGKPELIFRKAKMKISELWLSRTTD